jgi:hypothetical protein
MRVLAACSLGGQGHLDPLTPFLNAAVERGDDLVVVAPESMAEAVGRSGHRLWVGSEPPEEVVAAIRERLSVAPPAEASILGNRELFARIATEAMLPAMAEAFSAFEPELVLRDPCEYASAVLARRRGLTAAQVAISLAEVEAGSITVAEPALEAWDKGLTGWLRAIPYLSRFPDSIDASPFATTVRYRQPRPSATGSLPDWWPGRSALPLLYASFGTVLGYMSIAEEVYRAVVSACAELPARVLLTTGRRFDAALLGPLPLNVHVEAWLDQADVLGHAAAVLCHGGSGTVLGSLAAGVPVVVVPVFADQFENARRVAERGAGVAVLTARDEHGGRNPVSEADAPRIAGAVKEVLGDPSYGIVAAQVGEEIASSPSPLNVLGTLYAPHR